MFKLLIPFVIAVGVLVSLPMWAQWERPPMDSEQVGFRGTGMVQIDNPRIKAKLAAAIEVPEGDDPSDVEPEGKNASEVYDNVKVLGDLDQANFDRLMGAITEWVSPEEGCTYCHNEENLALDDKYTKIVARRMLQMTKAINTNWTNHVKETGVTCYTCHKGKPVPEAAWALDAGPRQAGGMAASLAGQNIASDVVGLTSLPFDPFATGLGAEGKIRVAAQTALPQGHKPNIKDTEVTYGLMMHLSKALGVNCTYCHNTRAFSNWEQSTPVRIQAFHGLSMVRDVNKNYIESLSDIFPANRKGPQGDVLKTNCATCHGGQPKPLGGAQMLKAYLVELNGTNESADISATSDETVKAATAAREAAEEAADEADSEDSSSTDN